MDENEYLKVLREKWDRVWPHPSLPREPVYPLGKIPLHEYLEKHAERNPSKDYLIYYGKRITYGEMDELSNRFANYLIENGVGKGDRVALILANVPQFYICYFGAFKAGAVCVLLNPLLKEIELEMLFNESKPTTIVTLDLLYPTVTNAANKALEDSTIISTSFQDYLSEEPEIPIHPTMSLTVPKQEGVTYLTEALEASSPKKPDVEVTLDDYATMNFTGGTTGLPKGVLHKHFNIIYTGACLYTYNYAAWLVENYPDQEVDFNAVASELLKDEAALVVVPIFWIAGNDMGVVSPTMGGYTAAIFVRWDPLAAMQAIEKYRLTGMYATFDMYLEILEHPDLEKYDLSSLRICAGSSFIRSLSVDLRRRWRELTGTILREASYGLTETHTFDCITGGFHVDDMDIKKAEELGATFCGIPCPGTLIKVVDEEGKPASFGEVGEVAIKSPSLVEGYVNRPEETAEAFRDGWLFTGDLGKYDDDGFFYFVSRKKDMIKVSGISVYPTQIEYIMLRNPAIELVGVIGVSDPEKGQVPVAYVKLKEDYKAKVTEEELRKWCKDNMAAYNVPKKIIIRDQLPLTATGKVIRKELAKEYEEGN
nr:AMP-binding protein [Candidatus Freyarchaeota archaeon]